jgi:hypothetical protein
MSKKVADLVETAFAQLGRRVKWTDLQVYLPTMTEYQIRRALMNATSQKYILIDTTRQRVPGSKQPLPASYYPNPARVVVESREKDLRERSQRFEKAVRRPLAAKVPDANIEALDDACQASDDLFPPKPVADDVVASALASRHPLDAWLR